jgi:flavorubredoxin
MVNQWDSMMVYEETTATLFPNDLWSNLGTDVTCDQDLSVQLVEGAKAVGYQADDRTAISRALDKVERLRLAAIAPMHGPVLTNHFDRYIAAFREGSVAALSERSALVGGP